MDGVVVPLSNKSKTSNTKKSSPQHKSFHQKNPKNTKKSNSLNSTSHNPTED
jgi:hypothetical protein